MAPVKVFRIELRILRKKLVVMPAAALFTIKMTTLGTKIAESASAENACDKEPVPRSTMLLQSKEFKYI